MISLSGQHGKARQQIVLPTDLLDKSKKYHLTFTIKVPSWALHVSHLVACHLQYSVFSRVQYYLSFTYPISDTALYTVHARVRKCLIFISLLSDNFFSSRSPLLMLSLFFSAIKSSQARAKQRQGDYISRAFCFCP